VSAPASADESEAPLPLMAPVTVTLFVVPAGHTGKRAATLIHRAGFDIVAARNVDPAALPTELRNGFTDGCHARLLITLDISPWSPQSSSSDDNVRVADRAPKIARELGEPLAWTDNTEQALSILTQLDERLIELVQREAHARAERMQVPLRFTVVQTYAGMRTNADVYLVDSPDGRGVLRMFRPGRERHMLNELRVGALAKDIPGIPAVLASGPNWVLTEYFDDAHPITELVDSYGLLPIQVARDCFELCRALYQRGLVLLDFIPRNALVDHHGRVHLIDFEWLAEVDHLEPFDTGPVVEGYVDKLKVAPPNGSPKSYDADWRPLIGFSYQELMYGPDWSLRLRWVLRSLTIRARRRLRAGTPALRGVAAES
jgi:hypothetical protein